MSEIINREAEDKYKGFRYQKLRLAKIILKKINDTNQKISVIGAIEYKDDLYLEEKGKIILEQDKLYSTNFSFSSPEVYKSVINFLDQYIELNNDECISFIFNTNVKISKEYQTKDLTSLGLTVLEKEKVIQLLNDKEFLDDDEKNEKLINFVSLYIKAKYKEEYKTRKGNIEKIENFSKQDWKNFLLKIHFNFEEEDYDELEKSLEFEIKRNKWYKSSMGNKELNLIKARILEEIDQRMVEKSVLGKILDSNLFKIIFFEVGFGEIIKIDPGHNLWDSVAEEKNDFRNLGEKIINVCKEFSSKGISKLTRDAMMAAYELSDLSIECQKSLKLRVFEAIEEYFDENILQGVYTEIELKELIRRLKEKAVEDLKDLKQDYDYSLKNEKVVENCVLLLINECYYSFD